MPVSWNLEQRLISKPCNCLQNVCRNKRNCQTECSVSFVSPWKHVSSRSHFCFKCHFSIPGFCPTLLSLPVLIKNFGIQTCTAFPWFALMQAQDIVNFSVFASIALVFMDIRDPEPRIMQFECIVGALRALFYKHVGSRNSSSQPSICGLRCQTV